MKHRKRVYYVLKESRPVQTSKLSGLQIVAFEIQAIGYSLNGRQFIDLSLWERLNVQQKSLEVRHIFPDLQMDLLLWPV